MYEKYDKNCTVCNEANFYDKQMVATYLGIRDVSNTPVVCSTCRSTNRHRIFLKFLSDQNQTAWKNQCAIRIGDEKIDKVLDAEFRSKFKSYAIKKDCEQNIDNTDIIIHNHFLDKTSDDMRVFKDLVMALNKGGSMHWMMPSPMSFTETTEWGFPDPDKWLMYRVYGEDSIETFQQQCDQLEVEFSYEIVEDPVSKESDYVFTVHK